MIQSYIDMKADINNQQLSSMMKKAKQLRSFEGDYGTGDFDVLVSKAQ